MEETMTAAKKETVVLFHAECNDGFGAALAAWKKFGESAEYIPVYHQTPPPAGLEGKEVYTLDYSYSASIVQELRSKVSSLTIIDHHKTNQEAIKLATRSLFSLDHSGAVLAWTYFHPGKPVPKLLEHIEDVDLWRFKLTSTRELAIFLDSHPKEFGLWDRLVSEGENEIVRASYIKEGESLLRYRNRLIEQVASYAQLVEFCGYKCLAVSSPLWASSLGQFLVKKLPPIAIVWHERNDIVVYSLRSDGTVDVSELALRFNGGGHKNASAFRLPRGTPSPFTVLEPYWRGPLT